MTTYKIFRFKGIELDDLYKKHLEIHYQLYDSREGPVYTNSVVEQVNMNRNANEKIMPRKKELMEKYQFLIHLLITKTFHKGYADLPSDYLKHLLGDRYNQMLVTLSSMGLISRNSNYKIGEYVRRIHVQSFDIECRQLYNAAFEKYKLKYLKKQNIIHQERRDKMFMKFGKEFVNQYIQNLNQLKLVDEIGARTYINESLELSAYSKEWNSYVLDRYISGKYFINIDRDNRIYSILTNSNKNLRSYLNVKFILDIINCHPLLFCKNIINQYAISDNILSKLKNIDLTLLFNKKYINYNQYDSNVFGKLLIDSVIQISELNGVSADQLLYISLTFQGRFWEYIMLNQQFVGVDRSDVKEKMFKEVFYSKVLGGKNMVYQEEFKKTFPSVFNMILTHRRKVKNGQDIHLSHYLMKTESEIIHNVLNELFKLGIVAVNIHDAIVILDVEKNIHLEINEIVDIFQLKIKNHGIYGNVKIEYFNSLE